MIRNKFNWSVLTRVFYVFVNPWKFFVAVIFRKAPREMTVRSPSGNLTISLRNFESLKTLFSVFCRGDYFTTKKSAGLFLDVGANIGIASVYFLSRHPGSSCVCVEPDLENLEYLRRNMLRFGARFEIIDHAVDVRPGERTLYRSSDGKYSSLLPSERATIPQKVKAESFDGLLKRVSDRKMPVIVKLDVEGIEVDLVKSVELDRHQQVRRLVCESTECACWISRKHRVIVRNGYIEDIEFLD